MITISKILKEILIVIVVVVPLIIGLNHLIGQSMKRNYKISELPKRRELATWLWKSPEEMSPENRDRYLNFSQEKGITTIYVDISNYIDLFEDQSSSDRTDKLNHFDSSVSAFVSEAAKRNIEVQALAGMTDWANDDDVYIPYLLVDYLYNYNQSHPETKLKGIQFDIEYYNQKDFAANKELFTVQYLNLVKKLVDIMKNKNMDERLGIAMPYWLDSASKNSIKINWQGDSQYPIFHLLNTLNEKNNTYIALMSYRTRVNGPGGVISVSSGELDYAERLNGNVTVLVSQETSDNKIENTTYYNKPLETLLLHAKEIDDQLGKYKNYGGLAIHSLDSFMQMR